MPLTRSRKVNENAVVGDGSRKARTNSVTNKPAAVNERRAALGEVSNNLVKADAVDHNRAENPTKGSSTFFNNLKHVKPKVDSHWKKSEIPPTANGIIGKRNNTQISPPKLVTAKSVKLAEVSVPQLVRIPAEGQTKSNNAGAQKRPVKRQESIVHKVQTRSGSIKPSASTGSTKPSTSLATKPSSSEAQSSGIIHKKCNAFSCSKMIAEANRLTHEFSHSASMLPKDVFDIDETDAGNLKLEPEYVKDIYNYLQNLEKNFQIPEKFLTGQKEVTPKMRTVLIDWLNEVHLQFHLFAETYYLTVGIIDRYLSKCPDTLRKNLQLVGVTAMFLACKYEEMYPPMLKDFVFITDDTYTPIEIIRMEQKILEACHNENQKLNYDLSAPVVIHFIRRYSKAADLSQTQHNMCKYFVELASVDYSMTHYLPTQLAATAVYMVRKLKTPLARSEELWSPTMRFYTKYELSDLLPIVCQLATIVIGAPKVKEQSVFTKYSSGAFDKVALDSRVNGAIMKGMCDN
ncbi:G2/mitotic-specific cyclin-B [Pseudolycoriella hygida]|uniref:G2/mitotic-specific cyclin-B n=1 Tax=Pseudolycoriella hygida TaxID=35572 RepID=A0A9Q0RXZ3_9DIPT|nr:G2/mitotic-specific cyclin-B [Pseudolycoriella hygida]